MCCLNSLKYNKNTVKTDSLIKQLIKNTVVERKFPKFFSKFQCGFFEVCSSFSFIVDHEFIVALQIKKN